MYILHLCVCGCVRVREGGRKKGKTTNNPPNSFLVLLKWFGHASRVKCLQNTAVATGDFRGWPRLQGTSPESTPWLPISIHVVFPTITGNFRSLNGASKICHGLPKTYMSFDGGGPCPDFTASWSI